ncbi:protein phosphatase 1 regulatory subunit 14A-like isoform X2 [Odocoileus virginianus]|uniref:Protein phosphatase 1 regulatory subunit 14 n=1 Tax=Odocoileus virginianus TaxID=9874 RepID=A0A6J0XG46_ODOVR|nr:protein phosphatase 1 regulatory subunit 14A-like isoform X2 [Odocoileus virginianus texanus]
MEAQRLGRLQAPSRARGPGGSPGRLQKRHARVTVKYDRQGLQRLLDVEKWIDGRLEELYHGREGLLKSCTNPTEDFIQELLAKLRGLHKQPGLRQPSPSGNRSLSPRQGRARTAPP